MLLKTDDPVHPLLLDLNFCRLPLAISSSQEVLQLEILTPSSLLPSSALLPFLTAPSFPKSSISILPHPFLLHIFLFQFPYILSLSSFLFYFFTWHATKPQCLSPKQVIIHPQRQKNNPSTPPPAKPTHIFCM